MYLGVINKMRSSSMSTGRRGIWGNRNHCPTYRIRTSLSPNCIVFPSLTYFRLVRKHGVRNLFPYNVQLKGVFYRSMFSIKFRGVRPKSKVKFLYDIFDAKLVVANSTNSLINTRELRIRPIIWTRPRRSSAGYFAFNVP